MVDFDPMVCYHKRVADNTQETQFVNNTQNIIKLMDVIDYIHKSDDAALEQLANAVQVRRNRKGWEVKNQMGIGSAVKFTSAKKRSPYTYTGTLLEKRQTRATVRITGPTWGKYAVGSKVTVPFAMLSEA